MRLCVAASRTRRLEAQQIDYPRKTAAREWFVANAIAWCAQVLAAQVTFVAAAGRWMPVGVEFNDVPAWVVTVFVQDRDPRLEQP